MAYFSCAAKKSSKRRRLRGEFGASLPPKDPSPIPLGFALPDLHMVYPVRDDVTCYAPKLPPMAAGGDCRHVPAYGGTVGNFVARWS